MHFIAQHTGKATSIKTVETHQAHIKKKLGLTSAHELTHRAIRWVLEQEPLNNF
jgi:DNA-binding NarL/FixJ family response regulator